MAPAYQKYPNRLRQSIKQSGFTIESVALETEIPLRTLFDYCAGRVPVPNDRLEVLAHALGYPREYLVPIYAKETLEAPLITQDALLNPTSTQEKPDPPCMRDSVL
jgi:hypothetical protein